MNWYVLVEGNWSNGKAYSDKLYCTSRAEARARANFYRTMCDPPCTTVKVVRT